jgi:ubiquinol-cytochrome c reductase cytochrome c subunit
MTRAGVIRSLIVGLLLAAPAPAAAATSEAVQGEHLYGQYCLSCHGPNGSGIPNVAPSLKGVGALSADFYLRTGYMPLQRVGEQPRRSRVLLSDAEIRALVDYVASLGPGPAVPVPDPASGDVATGRRLFTSECSGCHQVAIAGGYLTGAIAPSLADATPTQIAEAVRIGPNVMPRFSQQQITDRELNSIIAYVQYAKQPDDRGGWALGHLGPVPEGMVAWLFGGAVLIGFCVVIGERLRRA